jgi:hypothetical protein
MQAGLAAKSADRMSSIVVVTAVALVSVIVYLVARPLAMSSPFPTAGRGDWIIRAAAVAQTEAQDVTLAMATQESVAREESAAEPVITHKVVTERVVAPVPAPVETQAATNTKAKFAARWELAGVSRLIKPDDTPTTGSVRLALADESTPIAVAPPSRSLHVPAEAARIKPPDRKADVEPPKKTNPLEEVDRYLWEVYEREPVKKDNSGDFTWKDPAAAKRMHMSLEDYVIRGMEPDFREQLYHAGRALDAAGLRWSMLSAFRDDYRQELAAGFKARTGNSLHGGSRAVGGYGHGRAIDIMNTEGDDETVWRWLDAHGAKYGLRRPMPGYDPAHIQAGGDWHNVAQALRDSRMRTAAAKRPTDDASAALKQKSNRTAM